VCVCVCVCVQVFFGLPPGLALSHKCKQNHYETEFKLFTT